MGGVGGGAGGASEPAAHAAPPAAASAGSSGQAEACPGRREQVRGAGRAPLCCAMRRVDRTEGDGARGGAHTRPARSAAPAARGPPAAQPPCPPAAQAHASARGPPAPRRARAPVPTMLYVSDPMQHFGTVGARAPTPTRGPVRILPGGPGGASPRWRARRPLSCLRPGRHPLPPRQAGGAEGPGLAPGVRQVPAMPEELWGPAGPAAGERRRGELVLRTGWPPHSVRGSDAPLLRAGAVCQAWGPRAAPPSPALPSAARSSASPGGCLSPQGLGWRPPDCSGAPSILAWAPAHLAGPEGFS